MILRIAIRLAIVIAVTVVALAVRLHDDPEHARPPHVERPTAAVAIGTPLEEAGAIQTAIFLNYVDGIAVGEYLDALEAERLAAEAAAAEAARLEAARRAPVQPTLRTGNCCGPHSDAWWWGVAICEQGGRNDPYYGYFSFMDGSAGGKTWEEQVAMGNALLARVGRESPTWAASCVAAGYRASPGG